MVKAVLSRAASEDRPAAAYLLSGTRGVGKTTVARIFAKALNCQHAPGPEPCNTCQQCRKITQGNHVDVSEIDGASNNSVEDARALRETIGYAAMEGRYKVFIIDEAHMLSRSAFNAMLKTLEEPPGKVVFIFATTEAHKFPVTIVSRCQHFVFRHLGEDALYNHLSAVLQREEVSFEQSAVRLLSRRAAGSVRDGMSLLDQCLALAEEGLTVDLTRRVLGLAGQELFGELFVALAGRSVSSMALIARNILEQGVDIGFFVRELAGNLRNLFLLAQGGQTVAQSLQLPADDLSFWQRFVPQFSSAHLHAAWQMTLDAQRGIVQSPDPGSALELLLYNMALLPQLLPVGSAMPSSSGSSALHDQQNQIVSPAIPASAPILESSVAFGEENPVCDAFGQLDQGNAKNQPKEDCGCGQEAVFTVDPTNGQAENFDDKSRPVTEKVYAVNKLPGEQADSSDCLPAIVDDASCAEKDQDDSLSGAGWQAICKRQAKDQNLRYLRKETELVAEIMQKPQIKPCLDILKANIVQCIELQSEEWNA